MSSPRTFHGYISSDSCALVRRAIRFPRLEPLPHATSDSSHATPTTTSVTRFFSDVSLLHWLSWRGGGGKHLKEPKQNKKLSFVREPPAQKVKVSTRFAQCSAKRTRGGKGRGASSPRAGHVARGGPILEGLQPGSLVVGELAGLVVRRESEH